MHDFFIKIRRYQEVFFPQKFLVLMALFSLIQLFKFVVVVFQVKSMQVCCCFSGEKYDQQGQVPTSDFKNRKTFKIWKVFGRRRQILLSFQGEFCSKINWGILSKCFKYSQGEFVEKKSKYDWMESFSIAFFCKET